MHDPRKRRKRVIVATMMAVAVTVVLVPVITPRSIWSLISPHDGSASHSSTGSSNLPKDCSMPGNGYLIIASNEGFNDSILHGAPKVSWPVIRVQKGTTVSIVVCNIDTYPHGFQILHYFDSNVETVAPGQVIHISFVANEAGTFEIYCSILCPIHVFMQNAELVVSD